jgi:hypothetical protein
MAWNDLLDNQMITFADVSTFPIPGFTLKPGAVNSGNLKCITKAEAIEMYYLNESELFYYDNNQLIPKISWQTGTIPITGNLCGTWGSSMDPNGNDTYTNLTSGTVNFSEIIPDGGAISITEGLTNIQLNSYKSVAGNTYDITGTAIINTYGGTNNVDFSFEHFQDIDTTPVDTLYFTGTIYTESGTTVIVNTKSQGTFTSGSPTGYSTANSCTTGIPTLNTSVVSDISKVTAVSGGNSINPFGGFIWSKGIQWSTSPGFSSITGSAVNGSGSSDFTSSITGLTASTQYWVRAYASNDAGTGFGNVVNFTTTAEIPVFVSCNSTSTPGGKEIKDMSVSLSPLGGVVVFLLEPQALVDKLEIYHGLPQNGGVNKKATSSMSASGNYGPFDNYWSTPPGNLQPNDPSLATPQFIGANKPGVPTRQTEFTADTGFNVPSMNINGMSYDQIIWWKYTSGDYSTNPSATIRVTGGSNNTAWTSLRICF